MEENQNKPIEDNSLDQPAEELNSLDAISDGGAAADKPQPSEAPQPPKQKGRVRRFFQRINVYLLLFLLIMILGGAYTAVTYLNARKEVPPPTIALEDLSAEIIDEIAQSGDATIGEPKQLLNIQSNAVFTGQVLARGDVNIAGNLQLGQALAVPSITISGTSNLADTQVNSLSVASDMAVQQSLTVQQDLNVAGASTFNGPMTASSLAVSSLMLSGTGKLQVNNHIASGGPAPSAARGPNAGAAGSVSVSGNDTAGRVNVNPGSGTSAGCLVTVTFAQAFDRTPTVVITPINADGAKIQYYVQRSATSFSVCSANAPTAGSSYDYNYLVLE